MPRPASGCRIRGALRVGKAGGYDYSLADGFWFV